MKKQAKLQITPGVRRNYKGFRETIAYLLTVAGAKACMEVCIPLRWQIDTHLNDGSLRDTYIGGTPDKPMLIRCNPGPHSEHPNQEYTLYPIAYCLYPPIVLQTHKRFPTDVQSLNSLECHTGRWNGKAIRRSS